MNIIGGQRSPLAAAAAAIALLVAIGLLLWIRLHPAAVTLVTDGTRPDNWLASHPTTEVDFTLGDVAALTIPRGRSVTLRCAENDSGIREILLGTDGIALFMEVRGRTDTQTPPAVRPPMLTSVFTMDSIGERFSQGPPMFHALTWPPVPPNAPPSDSVAIRFAAEDPGSDAATAIDALDARLSRREIAPQDHTRGIDSVIATRWPDLGWRPRWDAP